MKYVESKLDKIQEDSQFSNFLGVFFQLCERNFSEEKLNFNVQGAKLVEKLLESDDDKLSFWNRLMVVRLIRFSTLGS